MSTWREDLAELLEEETHRPVPPPPADACDYGPSLLLMRLEREQRDPDGAGQ